MKCDKTCCKNEKFDLTRTCCGVAILCMWPLDEEKLKQGKVVSADGYAHGSILKVIERVVDRDYALEVWHAYKEKVLGPGGTTRPLEAWRPMSAKRNGKDERREGSGRVGDVGAAGNRDQTVDQGARLLGLEQEADIYF